MHMRATVVSFATAFASRRASISVESPPFIIQSPADAPPDACFM